jgi:hypothetical protein
VEDVKEFRFPLKTRLEEIFTAKVVIPGGETIMVKTLAASPEIKQRDIPAYMIKHINKDTAIDMNIGGVPFFTVDAFKLYYEMGKLAEKNTTIYTT